MMEKPLVMVIDDEKEMADEIAALIGKSGKYEVIAKYSAKDALVTLEKSKKMLGMAEPRVKCIVLDIKMPEMDGLQFLEVLRKDYEKNIGVIILSAYGDDEKWEKACKGMVAGYLRKPVDVRTLLSYLDGYFLAPDFFIQQANLMLMGERKATKDAQASRQEEDKILE